MNPPHLASTLPEPQEIPVDRLHRLRAEVYAAMVSGGLVRGDRVGFEDGRLVWRSSDAEGEPAGRLYRMPEGVFDQMVKLGLLGPGDRAELLDGLLVEKMTRNPPHVVCTALLVELLRSRIPRGWFVAKEDPVRLPAGPSGYVSAPEPDVAVVRGEIRDYLARSPGPGDLALVVEVAERSLRDDRLKAARYAWAGVPIAWIVDLDGRRLEVHSRPTGPMQNAGYQECTLYDAEDRVPVVIDGREVGGIVVREVLP